ncbi:hypothetical protein ALQ64_03595 [Pseudomonas cannabina]|uniref:DUF4329 domain-containing protein n=1 Tax=Pseudomonas cannabina TaxID=86840 RepID=A0A0P9PX72_PSECA|nr:Uncharacterized protein ALO81_03652 [Pseudomonas cannabina]RMN18434.1 hypothetical protein ALQ64_03595 [Pseudomonas cannabina]
MYPRKIRSKRSVDHHTHPGMPALSKPFDNPDDAARYAHERIGNRRDREYGGFILVREDGKYVATEPMNGSQFSFDPNEVFPRNEQKGYVLYPHGHDDYAIYHSHPSLRAGLHEWPESEQVTYPNSFSAGDIYAVMIDQEICPATYLSGPDGSLIKYTLSGSAAERALFTRVAGPTGMPHMSMLSQVHKALQNLTLMPSDVVRLLADAGNLEVLVSSPLWGRSGKVSSNWRPFPDQALSSLPKVTSPTVCEAVWPPKALTLSAEFASADAAAHYVHAVSVLESTPGLLAFCCSTPSREPTGSPSRFWKMAIRSMRRVRFSIRTPITGQRCLPVTASTVCIFHPPIYPLKARAKRRAHSSSRTTCTRCSPIGKNRQSGPKGCPFVTGSTSRRFIFRQMTVL